MQRLLIISPHLSTGGLPQYLLRKAEHLAGRFEVHVVEYSCISPDYVVQRNQVIKLVGRERFASLGADKMDLLAVVNRIAPHIIHFEEIPELFCDEAVAKAIYRQDRAYLIVETTHTATFDTRNKRFLPDKFMFVSEFSRQQYQGFGVPNEVVEYPSWQSIRGNRQEALSAHNLDPSVKHVLNVGLFTPGKNQAYAFEIARRMPEALFHFIGNQASNFRAYWGKLQPPVNCILWGERGDVDSFYRACDLFLFTSLNELNPLVVKEALAFGMPVLMRNLPAYCGRYHEGGQIGFLTGNYDPDVAKARRMLSGSFTEFYSDIKRAQCAAPSPEITCSFVNGPRVDICGGRGWRYDVDFIDQSTGKVSHQAAGLTGDSWAAASRQWFTDWRIRVTSPGLAAPYERSLDLKGQRVYIAFESRSLGDTVAWFPYVDEFRKKHECKVICSTFWNQLFRGAYPELECVEPGSSVENLFAMYKVGAFTLGDRRFSPTDWNKVPLQAVARGILGLDELGEIRPRIDIPGVSESPIDHPYVCVAPWSTMQAKYWNHQSGWKDLCERIAEVGLEPINISHRGKFIRGVDEIPGVRRLPDGPIERAVHYLRHCSFFVGLPSGLSWLAWALGKPVVMISGFSEPWTEFESGRVLVGPEPGLCHGCFNRKQMEKGDWNWCPDHKNTPRQFECTATITPAAVFSAIKKAGLLSLISPIKQEIPLTGNLV